MSNDRRRILDLLAAGKISATEAEELLTALQSEAGEMPEGSQPSSNKCKPKYLRIICEPGAESGSKKCVNIRVPLALIRAGIKLGSILPGEARDKVNQALKEKGINLDLDTIKPEQLDELMAGLNDFCVDVQDGAETAAKVKICCE
jgi:hypothetical protein